MPFAFDPSYARLPERFFAKTNPTPVSQPTFLAANEALANFLGLSKDDLTSNEGIQTFAGNLVPENADSIALAYAGHQFGNFVPRLGDGRAILMGELRGQDGKRYDVQLKGAGPTPFSRGGDGRAAIGPVLREYLVSEAMAALGIPTTRALAAIATGEIVYREDELPGAVLTRVASSHLRVGTFQYFAAREDLEALTLLTDYALSRHYPEAKMSGLESGENPALTLLNAVMRAQCKLVARWLSVGFVHGVMNTDNSSISGETIDYGPCAFLDTYDPDRAFSSIDRRKRYAFMQQPHMAQWNLTRLAETLLPLLGEDENRAIEVVRERLDLFPAMFDAAYTSELRKKLGLFEEREDDFELARDLLERMAKSKVDYTLFFRRLSDSVESGDSLSVALLFQDPDSFHAWHAIWQLRLQEETTAGAERSKSMRSVNPAFIPRNHRVEEMIASAINGDMKPFERLMRVLSKPYDDQPEQQELANPPGEDQWNYRTFCGT